MTEKIYCPSCSKAAFVNIPGKFECQDCRTKFIVDDNKNVTIVKKGNIKLSLVLMNMLWVPIVFILIFILVPDSGDYFSKRSLKIFSFFMVSHPILFAPRELWSRAKYNEAILIELYFGFLTGRLSRYGSIQKIYFYSSFVVFTLGVIILLISSI